MYTSKEITFIANQVIKLNTLTQIILMKSYGFIIPES